VLASFRLPFVFLKEEGIKMDVEGVDMWMWTGFCSSGQVQ
jgi:hypothetical protein